MRYVFFAEKVAPKVDGLSVGPQPIRSVGIVGAGLMGGGIAMSCVAAGIPTVLIDATPERWGACYVTVTWPLPDRYLTVT